METFLLRSRLGFQYQISSFSSIDRCCTASNIFFDESPGSARKPAVAYIKVPFSKQNSSNLAINTKPKDVISRDYYSYEKYIELWDISSGATNYP